ncbi:MAG: chemotaxis protein CheR [Deltaproteobacteria bacterium]|nr:chemotaxis protein CheR [Deltaproteobacteria bacterium]
MAAVVSEVLLEQFSKFVAERIGLHFPKERWRDLERGIRSAAKELGFQETESFLQHVLSSPLPRNQLEILASNLTVGETYFYRDKKAFEALEEHILPELLHSLRGKERRLRIWSAGCCTGEEPYSLAILLSKVIADLKDWNITILATDINPRFLKKASLATYSEWSFRDAPQWLKEKYLTRVKDGHFEIVYPIKKMVTFSHLNLAEDVYPSLLNNTNAMDIIFCRNVLMYFTPEQTKKVIQNLYNSLADGGWLIVSSIENSSVLYPQFTTVNFHGLTVYRKNLSSQPVYSVADFGTRIDLKLDTLNLKLAPAEPEPVFTSHLEPLASLEAEVIKPAVVQPIAYEEALALYREGLYTEVTERLLGVLSKNGADSKATSLLARAYANQGKLIEALEWCEKAVVDDKLNPGLYYLQATILEEQGAMEAAVASLKRALYLYQDFVLVHFALGSLSMRQRKLKQADKHFENAISLLKTYHEEAIIPESEGITAGRLLEIIQSTRYVERLI